MASDQGGYNPVEYHNGTVWRHDNSLIAAGLRPYGYTAQAARVADSMVRAAAYLDHRLPEVFAGCDERLTAWPVEYPTALCPRARAAAAALVLLSATLGLESGEDGPVCDPTFPPASDASRSAMFPAAGDGPTSTPTPRRRPMFSCSDEPCASKPTLTLRTRGLANTSRNEDVPTERTNRISPERCSCSRRPSREETV